MKLNRFTLATALLATTLAMPHLVAAEEKARPDLESQFVRLDLNSDGQISRKEWVGGAETFGGLDRDADGVVARVEFFARGVRYKSREERFLELDSNRDGLLSASEWKWGPKTLAALDHDHDGSLTPQEFLCKQASTTK